MCVIAKLEITVWHYPGKIYIYRERKIMRTVRLGCSLRSPIMCVCFSISQGLEECFDIATEPEIERCILDEKSRAEENSQCQTCSFSVINVVNISCVLIIPENEQPRSSDQDVVERRIEEFAAEELAG